MVEKSHSGERHDHIIFVATIYNEIIANGSAGLGNVRNAALVGALDVIAEREERIGAESHAGDGGKICLLLLNGERRGLSFEVLLPISVGANILFVLIDVTVDDVVAVGTANGIKERQIQNLVVLTQEPGIGLTAGKTCAMDSRLLTGADADGLTVISIANGIRLRVFKSDKSDDEIARGSLREFFVFGDDIRQQSVVDLELVSSLLEGDAVDLLALDRVGLEARVDLNNIVCTLALGLEYLKCFIGIVGCDNAVRNLALEKRCGQGVAGVGKCDPISEGTHTVSTSGTSICTSNGRLVKSGDVVDKASLFKLIGQRKSDSRRGGADVLERCGAGKTGLCLDLLDELPRVEGIEEVDITGAAIEYLDRQLRAVMHIYFGRLLIGVTAVFKFKFFHLRVSLYIFIYNDLGGLCSVERDLTDKERDLVVLVKIAPAELGKLLGGIGKSYFLRLAHK